MNSKGNKVAIRILVLILSLVFLFACIYICFFSPLWGFGKAEKAATDPIVTPSVAVSDSSTEISITLAQFNAVQTDMSEEEMFEILGGEGIIISASTIGEGDFEITTTMYQYAGSDSFGANAHFTIQNGKVASKAQFGLK